MTLCTVATYLSEGVDLGLFEAKFVILNLEALTEDQQRDAIRWMTAENQNLRVLCLLKDLTWA